MATSPRETGDYRYPRWLVYSAAGGCAFVYASAFLVANVFPYDGGEHGWPLVYMVRATRMPGALSVYYGPWPIFDPPLVSFHVILLAFNVLLGIGLALCAAVIAVYWLRITRTSPRFSLLALLGFMTAVCCLAAFVMMMVVQPSDVVWPMIVIAQRCVYIVPCLLVVTLVHWMLRLPDRTWNRRRWSGVHWLTWLVAGVMAGPFLYHCFFAHTGYLDVGSEKVHGVIMLPSYGWPFEYMAECDQAAGYRQGTTDEGFPLSYFNRPLWIADILIALAVIAATGFVVERWIRRTQRGERMSRTATPAAVAVAGVVAWILWMDQSFRPGWYVYPFWLFGIACAVFAGLVLLTRAAAYVRSEFQQQSPDDST